MENHYVFQWFFIHFSSFLRPTIWLKFNGFKGIQGRGSTLENQWKTLKNQWFLLFFGVLVIWSIIKLWCKNTVNKAPKIHANFKPILTPKIINFQAQNRQNINKKSIQNWSRSNKKQHDHNVSPKSPLRGPNVVLLHQEMPGGPPKTPPKPVKPDLAGKRKALPRKTNGSKQTAK